MTRKFSSRTRRSGLVALVLAAAVLAGAAGVRSASAADCKEGAQKDVTTTIDNPNGPGVATQTKTYQCVGGQWVLVVTTIVSSCVLPGDTWDPPTNEFVSVDSVLHFVTNMYPDGSQELVHANVSDATAVGETSGAKYRFTGSDDNLAEPAGPLALTFQLAPTGAGGPPATVSVGAALALTFDDNGDFAGAVASFPQQIV